MASPSNRDPQVKKIADAKAKVKAKDDADTKDKKDK
jgi:hypothetical protein